MDSGSRRRDDRLIDLIDLDTRQVLEDSVLTGPDIKATVEEWLSGGGNGGLRRTMQVLFDVDPEGTNAWLDELEANRELGRKYRALRSIGLAPAEASGWVRRNAGGSAR